MDQNVYQADSYLQNQPSVMSGKRTLRAWQFAVLLVFSVSIFITMFIPAFRINGNAAVDATKVAINYYKDHVGKEEVDVWNDYVSDEINYDEIKKKFDKEVEEGEKKVGHSISHVSPLSIMTKSLRTFSGTSKESWEKSLKQDGMREMNSGWTKLRVIFWIIYSLDLCVMIFSIIGFCLRLSKYISLIVHMTYGLFAVITFGWLRFGLMRRLVNFIFNIVKVSDRESFDSIFSSFLLEKLTKNLYVKMFSCFYSASFLLAFIFAILLLIAGVVFLFVGNQRAVSGMQNGAYGQEKNFGTPDMIYGQENVFGFQEQPFYGQGSDMMRQNISPQFATEPAENQETAFAGSDEASSFATEAVWQEQPAVSQQNPLSGQSVSQDMLVTEALDTMPASSGAQAPVVPVQMGRVQCTKGNALGQGFSLPEDRKVVVGKNPQKANLVINHQHISGLHCSIRYVAARNTYIVKDHSMNGTFVNGIRLQKEVAMECPAGTVLSLADGSNEITLG